MTSWKLEVFSLSSVVRITTSSSLSLRAAWRFCNLDVASSKLVFSSFTVAKCSFISDWRETFSVSFDVMTSSSLDTSELCEASSLLYFAASVSKLALSELTSPCLSLKDLLRSCSCELWSVNWDVSSWKLEPWSSMLLPSTCNSLSLVASRSCKSFIWEPASVKLDISSSCFRPRAASWISSEPVFPSLSIMPSPSCFTWILASSRFELSCWKLFSRSSRLFLRVANSLSLTLSNSCCSLIWPSLSE